MGKKDQHQQYDYSRLSFETLTNTAGKATTVGRCECTWLRVSSSSFGLDTAQYNIKIKYRYHVTPDTDRVCEWGKRI